MPTGLHNVEGGCFIKCFSMKTVTWTTQATFKLQILSDFDIFVDMLKLLLPNKIKCNAEHNQDDHYNDFILAWPLSSCAIPFELNLTCITVWTFSPSLGFSLVDFLPGHKLLLTDWTPFGSALLSLQWRVVV